MLYKEFLFIWKYWIIDLKFIARHQHLIGFVIVSFVRVIMFVVVMCCQTQFWACTSQECRLWAVWDEWVHFRWYVSLDRHIVQNGKGVSFQGYKLDAVQEKGGNGEECPDVLQGLSG